jgi:DNA-binding GntR family transcriptional regulator
MVLGDPLKVQSLADQAFDKIVTAIVRGDLPPGSRIAEAMLARSLGISRGPLREALRRLEGRKLVVRTPHVGAHVASLTPDDLIEIFFVREALEGMACRLATERMSDRELATLKSKLAAHAQDSELSSGAGYFQEAGDQDFHYLMAQGSKSAKLIELLCDDLYYLMRVYRFRSSVRPGRARQAFDEHHRILKSMQARDADRAEALMREHVAQARRSLAAAVADGKEAAA